MAIEFSEQPPKAKSNISGKKVALGAILGLVILLLAFLCKQTRALKAQLLSQGQIIQNQQLNQAQNIKNFQEIEERLEEQESRIQEVSSGDLECENCITLAKETKGSFVAKINESNQIEVQTSGKENAIVTLQIKENSISDTYLQYKTGQNLTEASSPIFNSLTLNNLTLTSGLSCVNCITLGEETKGNYISTITGSAQITVISSGEEASQVVLKIQDDSIGDDQLAFDTGQNLTETSSPIFNNLTLNSLNIASSKFVIDSNGNITKIRNILYSWPSLQGAANTILQNDGSGNLTWTTIGAASVTPDSLDFTEFKDDLTLDNNLTVSPSGANYSMNIDSGLFFVDTANNRIGIGTTSPISLLELYKSDNPAVLTLTTATSSDTYLAFRTGSTPTTQALIGIDYSDSNKLKLVRGSDISSFAGITIDSSGNVGIGTTSPGAKLEVLPFSSSEIVFRTKSLQSTAALGDELVSNGDFSTVPETAWTWGTGWTHDTTNLEADHTPGNTAALTQNISVTSGQTYQVEITIKNRTTGSVTLDINGVYIYNYGLTTALNSNATYQRSLVANITGSATLSITPTSDFNGSVDNITVKQITGVSQPNFALLDDEGSVMAEIRGKNSLGNIALGTNALRLNTTGSYNSAIGTNALYSNTTGFNNSAIGANALYSNTTGFYNSAIGMYALYSNTTGYNNSAIGINALRFNTTGYNNSAIGMYALYSNTTGSYNSAIGTNALRFNTTGYNNSAIGANALYSNTTGSYNSAVGASALYSNTTGFNNSAIGTNALRFNTTGFNNSAIGANALYSNTTGSYNLAIGYNAGRYITGGGANQTSNTSLYLGAETKAYADGDNNEIVIGYNTTGFGSNTAAYGNSSITKHIFQAGNVGIGTTSPISLLELYKSDNPAVLTLTTATSSDTYLAFRTGSTPTTQALIGIDYSDSNKLKLVRGSDISSFAGITIDSSGNVGIGTTAPDEKLDVAGNIKLSGNITDGTYSIFVNQISKVYQNQYIKTTPKIWTGTATTTGGVATFYPTTDGTATGDAIFTNVYSIQATAELDTTSAIGVPLASVKSLSTDKKTLTVNVVKGRNLSTLDDTMEFVPDGTKVYVTIIGD